MPQNSCNILSYVGQHNYELDRNSMYTAHHAIEDAERILHEEAPSEEGDDPRWQAIIRVAEFAEDEPDLLWTFARKWGSQPDPDLRQGVASCLVEHLLQFHFSYLFPRVAAAAREDPLFAETLLGCWEFGQTEEPDNAARLRALKEELERRSR